MTRKRILSMLALLMTAVTGAWAQEQSETIATTTDNTVEGTHFTIDNNGVYVDTDGMSAYEGITVTAKNEETITKVVISCTFNQNIVKDGNTSVSSGTKEITNGGGTITVTGVNASTFTFYCSDYGPQFRQFVVYYTEAGPTCYTVSMKEGTEDATSWTIAPPEATTTGVVAGTEVTATYSGTKKVKSVKAKKKAAPAPAAAIAPALMDGATVEIEYNCDGFVTNFTFTNNAGTYSCNITGDESDYFSASLTKQGNTLVFVAHHSDMPDNFDSTINFDTTSDTYSFAKKTQDLFYFKISVNGTDITDKLSETASATITVTWNNDDITDTWENSFTKDGVTITAADINFRQKNFYGDGTFTTTLGNFTKIEVTTASWYASGTGWSGSDEGGIWTGNASSVSFSGNIMGEGEGNTKFVFTIEPTN